MTGWWQRRRSRHRHGTHTTSATSNTYSTTTTASNTHTTTTSAASNTYTTTAASNTNCNTGDWRSNAWWRCSASQHRAHAGHGARGDDPRVPRDVHDGDALFRPRPKHAIQQV